MVILSVSADHDYRPDVLSADITQIDFQGPYTATFNQSQFGGAGISNALLISGSGSIAVFLSPGGSGFSAELWVVAADGDAVVRFFGTDADETITSVPDSSVWHEFTGGGGADTLIGNNGDDLFIYAAPGDAAPGEKIDGVGDEDLDDDTISVRANNDFTKVDIVNIEQVQILGDGTTATFLDTHLRLPFDSFEYDRFIVEAEEFGNTVQTLIVEAGSEAYVNLNNVWFWHFKAEDEILINGSAKEDILIGSFQDDVIDGRAGKDYLDGYKGQDALDAGAGADRLDGGHHKDTLTGGSGDDAFVFTKALNGGKNLDHITDFATSQDLLRLKVKAFAGLDNGKLSKDAFFAGKKAVKAAEEDDRIVYNETTGALYFDKDGKGGAKAIQFAVLDGAPDLKASDIVVFG